MGGKGSPGFCSIARFLTDTRPYGVPDSAGLYRLIGSGETSGNRQHFEADEDFRQVFSTRRDQKNCLDLLAANQAKITQTNKYDGLLRFEISGRSITFPTGK